MVGSSTKQGAHSLFLYESLERICLALGGDKEDYLRAISQSFMVSADNAHAVHPNHPEHYDPVNRCYMNKGVVVKTHSGQKYTSDGQTIAVLRMIAEEAGVPLQYFSNRSDKNGGRTLGHLSATHVSVRSVDIGLPQLAMHSAYETAGSKDIEYLVELMKTYYSTKILVDEDDCLTTLFG